MNHMEPSGREFAEIIRHTILVCAVLSVWAITAWWIDRVVLNHVPLEGMSIISFRLLEFILHISTFRLIYKTLFKRRVQARWWV